MRPHPKQPSDRVPRGRRPTKEPPNPPSSVSTVSSTPATLSPAPSNPALSSYIVSDFDHGDNPTSSTGSVEPYEQRDTSNSASFTPTSEGPSGAHPVSRGSPRIPSSEQVRTDSGRSSQAPAEQEPRSSRRESRSPDPRQPGSSSAGQGSSGQSTRVRRKPKTQVSSACWKCKKDHLSCDVKRPCHRCVSSGQECYDVPPKKRGRPKLDQRVEPESSTSIDNRGKRQRNYYFEINPGAALPSTGPADHPPGPQPRPPSSYRYQPAPVSEPPTPSHSRSHHSYGTVSSSSLYSDESGQQSSRVSRESQHSVESYRRQQHHERPGSTSSSERHVSSGQFYPVPGPVPTAYGHPSSPNRNSPTAYNFGNLASSLPSASPPIGTHLGLPGPQYRPQNPVNPQNHGTRPQRRPSPAPYSHAQPHETPYSPSNYSSPASPLRLQHPPAGYPTQQLPTLQPRVTLTTRSAPHEYDRVPSSRSQTTSADLPPIIGSASQLSSVERYDPVQEASGTSHRQHRMSTSAREGSSEPRRHHRHAHEGHRRGNGHSSGHRDDQHGSGRRTNRSMKLSEVMD